jgi:hypothetical protein
LLFLVLLLNNEYIPGVLSIKIKFSSKIDPPYYPRVTNVFLTQHVFGTLQTDILSYGYVRRFPLKKRLRNVEKVQFGNPSF